MIGRILVREEMASTDGPAPEVDGRSPMYISPDKSMVVALRYCDELTMWGYALRADPHWRDRYEWAEDDLVADGVFSSLCRFVRGKPPLCALWSLPWEAVRDFFGMCALLRRWWPDGVVTAVRGPFGTVTVADWEGPMPVDHYAVLIAVNVLCDEYWPREEEFPEFSEPLRWRFVEEEDELSGLAPF